MDRDNNSVSVKIGKNILTDENFVLKPKTCLPYHSKTTADYPGSNIVGLLRSCGPSSEGEKFNC